jgi:hypothetical protein
MQRAKLQQAWYTARANADDAARRRIDAAYKSQKLVLDQQQNTIDQQERGRLDHSRWRERDDARRRCPGPTPRGEVAAPVGLGDTPEVLDRLPAKIASAMYNAPKLFGEAAGPTRSSGPTSPSTPCGDR